MYIFKRREKRGKEESLLRVRTSNHLYQALPNHSHRWFLLIHCRLVSQHALFCSFLSGYRPALAIAAVEVEATGQVVLRGHVNLGK